MTANREARSGIWKHMNGAGRGLRIVRPMVEDLMNEKKIEGEYSKNTQICLRRRVFYRGVLTMIISIAVIYDNSFT
jgi:sarcosine oxidase delta subunit